MFTLLQGVRINNYIEKNTYQMDENTKKTIESLKQQLKDLKMSVEFSSRSKTQAVPQ